MKVKVDRELTSSGIDSSVSFDLSMENASHIMTILRDTLYSDRILAVIREYGSNAWDAHRMCGKHDVPIKVELPVDADPTLKIRDYGPGMSEDEVFTIFTKYGKSTKRGTDDAVGMLGIGSKSGFAYADSFNVTSWNGGTKSIYVAVLDETDKGTMNLLHREDCPESETGIEIQISVDKNDCAAFHQKAERIFKHFVPRPEINCHLPELGEGTQLHHGHLYHVQTHQNRGWTAVMGCVPYRVDLNQVKDVEPGLGKFAYDLSGVLKFDIGDVAISASREELKYNDKTKKAIVEKLNALIDEYIESTLKSLEGKSQWARRCGAAFLRSAGIPLSEGMLKQHQFNLRHKFIDAGNEESGGFLAKPCVHGRPISFEGIIKIAIHPDVELVIRDTNKAISGYGLRGNQYVLKKRPGFTHEQVKAELEKVVKDSSVEGIPVKMISSFKWISASQASGKISNVKHNRKIFRFDPRPHSAFRVPLSGDWEVADRAPLETDVYVVINRFVPQCGNFQERYAFAERAAVLLKIRLPEIWAHKETDSKPFDSSKAIGVPFNKWFDSLCEKLKKNKKAVRLMELKEWAAVDARSYSYRYQKTTNREIAKEYEEELGAAHPICAWLSEFVQNRLDWGLLSGHDHKLAKSLTDYVDFEPECEQRHKALGELYPLLIFREHSSIMDIFELQDTQMWRNYIKSMDALRAFEAKESEKKDAENSVHIDEGVDQPGLGGEGDDGIQGPTELHSAAGCP